MSAPSALGAPPSAGPVRAPPRRPGGSFLGGAKGRLLPASVPLRFFGAALVFHMLAWLALLAGAAELPRWRGGLGWPLAALHLLTLGTLLCSAIGASLQLLPVATRQPLRRPALIAALWWAYVPGVAVLVLGMGLARPPLLALGAAAVLGALAVYVGLLALNLRGARGMPGVVLHGWGAVAGLLLLGASAAALVAGWLGGPLIDPAAARTLHLLAGVFGAMGLLALGLSYILLPMFALAPSPAEAGQRASGLAALAAIALAAAGAFATPALGWRLAAIAAGALALGLHLRLVRRTLAGGLRRELGRALGLMRLGSCALAAALALALAEALAPLAGLDGEGFGRLAVLLAVAGWLLSFLLGVLQRILPFLASLHAAQGQRRPPTPSALTLDRALQWHAFAHPLALALLLAATALDAAWLLRAAALVGLAGAAAYGVFFAVLMQRMRRAAPPRRGIDRAA